MSDRNFKEIRKQLRNISKEQIQSLLSEEVYSAIEKRLTVQIAEELAIIQTDITNTLRAMDERSKDVQQFIMNQIQGEMAKSAPRDTFIPTPELGDLEPKATV